MILICKLLRRHVSVLQLAGFLLANLLGMLIVLLSIQFYQDVRPLFGQEDGIINPDYMIVHKQVGALDALGLGNSTFTEAEIQDLRQQPFCKRADGFVSSQYKVSCSLGFEGGMSMGTALFFESVPSEYPDTSATRSRITRGSLFVKEQRSSRSPSSKTGSFTTISSGTPGSVETVATDTRLVTPPDTRMIGMSVPSSLLYRHARMRRCQSPAGRTGDKSAPTLSLSAPPMRIAPSLVYG